MNVASILYTSYATGVVIGEIYSGKREFTAKEIGFFVLIAVSGPVASKLIKIFARSKQANKVLSALLNASIKATAAAKVIRKWTPKNKYMKNSTSKTKARFDTDDENQVREWVAEALESPNAMFLPNPNLEGTFRVVTDLGKRIGVKGQQRVRIVVGSDGKVINASPVHNL